MGSTELFMQHNRCRKLVYSAFVLIFPLLFFLVGCASSNKGGAKVELIQMPGDIRVLTLLRDEWDGIFSTEGYVGYQTHGYRIRLVGNGSHFENCKTVVFKTADYSRYHSNVSLDLEKQSVIIYVWEEVQKSDGTKRRVKHNISGKYHIDAVRPATESERFNFSEDNW
jgi:hypothetical protein